MSRDVSCFALSWLRLSRHTPHFSPGRSILSPIAALHVPRQPTACVRSAARAARHLFRSTQSGTRRRDERRWRFGITTTAAPTTRLTPPSLTVPRRDAPLLGSLTRDPLDEVTFNLDDGYTSDANPGFISAACVTPGANLFRSFEALSSAKSERLRHLG